MDVKILGQDSKGNTAKLYTFSNSHGMKITVSNFGALLTNVYIPDQQGRLLDVVLGYDDFAVYQQNTETYFSATIGRSANRIEKSTFQIDGVSYHLTSNEGENNLHSGPNGYQLRFWEVDVIDEEANSITFLLHSPDGDQGFPGNLQMKVTYELTENNEISISYEGISDKATVFNPTNHSYFNLNSHDSGSILTHELQIKASKFTPIKDSTLIPTGEELDVADTPMDFRDFKQIGQEIDVDFAQLNLTKGYDHNFVLDKQSDGIEKVAEVRSSNSGISMEVSTDLPGIQLYTGNALNEDRGKNGTVYRNKEGFCLETQYFPNSINQAGFDSPVIQAREQKQLHTIYRFFSEGFD